MTNPPRVAPGTPAGGQFAAENRPRPAVSLGPSRRPPEAETAIERQRAAHQVFYEASQRHQAVTAQAVVDTIRAEHPHAERAVVSLGDDEDDSHNPFGYRLYHVLDSDGQPVSSRYSALDDRDRAVDEMVADFNSAAPGAGVLSWDPDTGRHYLDLTKSYHSVLHSNTTLISGTVHGNVTIAGDITGPITL